MALSVNNGHSLHNNSKQRSENHRDGKAINLKIDIFKVN